MKRRFVLFSVGVAFLGGFVTAYLLQGLLWKNGVRFSIEINHARLGNPISLSTPPSPETTTSSYSTPCLQPQVVVPEVSSESPKKTPEVADGNSRQVCQIQQKNEATKQFPGYQDTSKVFPHVASSKESITDLLQDSNKEVAPVSSETRKKIQEPKGVLPPPPGAIQVKAQAAAPETLLGEERTASRTAINQAATPEPSSRKLPTVEAPLPKVVVKKGECLLNIIAQHYPDQKNLGLEALILANPEIRHEDFIYPGQVLNIPRLDAAEKIIRLQNQKHYAHYGSYSSAAAWKEDKVWLEKNQVRFVVRVSQESTGKLIHRVFLGGYDTETDLKEARDRLLAKAKGVQPEKKPETSGGPAPDAGQETANSVAFSGQAASNSVDLAPPTENQPAPAPPIPSVAPEGKGESCLKMKEMAAIQSFPPPGDESRPPEIPWVHALKQVAASADSIVHRYHNVLSFLLSTNSQPESQQATSRKNSLAQNNVGNSMKVCQSAIPKGDGRTRLLEPSPRWFSFLPSASRHLKILGVLFSNFPEFTWQPIFLGKEASANNCEIQGNDSNSGQQVLQSGDETEEQKSHQPSPEPCPSQALLPPGVIRRYWDAQSVLHIVNGEYKKPNPETVGVQFEGLEQGKPVARKEHQELFSVRNVSWPAKGQNLRETPDPNTLEKTLPPGAKGTIRQYRDAKGVLNITNRKRQESMPTAVTTLAGNKDKIGQDRNNPLKSVSFPLQRLPQTPLPTSPHEALPPIGEGKKIETVANDGRMLPLLKKVALTLRTGPMQAPIKGIPSPKREILTSGGIYRYRDAQGVIHIKTLERPKPEPVASRQLLAKSRNLPDGGGGQGLRRATSGVVAFQDRRGRLIVRNRIMETKVAEGSRQEKVMAQVAPFIQEASSLYGLPVTLIQALIKVESNFVLGAVSPKGAMGLMQLMPETAAYLGVQDPFNPRENIHGGCRYLRLMVDHFGGSLPLALAAYNAGPQRVISCDFQIPPIKETQNFVTKVLERYCLLTNQGI